MTPNTVNHVESASTLLAKAGPPVSISLATVAGLNVADLLLWATLVYTLLMIIHKLIQMWRDIRREKRESHHEEG